MLDAAHQAGMVAGPARPCPVDALLPDGTRVVGSVPLRLGGEADGTSGPAALYYSRFKPTHRVAAWLDLMALVATDPSRRWRSLAVSRPERPGADADDQRPGSVAGRRRGLLSASDGLAVAVDCYRRGMTEPLALFPTFSWYLYRGKSARGRWHGYPFPEDGDHLAVRLAFDDRDFDGITGLAPRPTDPRGVKGRAMRFATYLHRTIDQSTTSPPDGDVEPDLEPGGRTLMPTDDALRFDLADPLPRGKLAIQASAGTGQDVHPGRPGHPVHRRGPGVSLGAVDRHLHQGRHRRAAVPGQGPGGGCGGAPGLRPPRP